MKEEIKDIILREEKKGNICYMTVDGLITVSLKEFIAQPIDGLLYDLNRDKMTIMSFLDDIKWVNDYAVSIVITALHAQLKHPQPEKSCEKCGGHGAMHHKDNGNLIDCPVCHGMTRRIAEVNAEHPSSKDEQDAEEYRKANPEIFNQPQPERICKQCGKKLTHNEFRYYGNTCNNCEGKNYHEFEIGQRDDHIRQLTRENTVLRKRIVTAVIAFRDIDKKLTGVLGHDSLSAKAISEVRFKKIPTTINLIKTGRE